MNLGYKILNIPIAVIIAPLVMFMYTAFAETTVVLPQEWQNAPVVVKNSPQFKSLVAHSVELQKQLAVEQASAQKLNDWADQTIRQKDQDYLTLQAENNKLKIEAAQNKRKGIWGMFLGLLQVGLNFILNPFGSIINVVISVVEGLIALFVIYILVRWLYHRLKVR